VTNEPNLVDGESGDMSGFTHHNGVIRRFGKA
jgi:hypothetical protein